MVRTAFVVALALSMGCASLQPGPYDSPSERRNKTLGRWAVGILTLGMADARINPHRYQPGGVYYNVAPYGVYAPTPPPQKIIVEHRVKSDGIDYGFPVVPTMPPFGFGNVQQGTPLYRAPVHCTPDLLGGYVCRGTNTLGEGWRTIHCASDLLGGYVCR